MAEPISDAAIVTLLRPFVRAARPVLAGLREADPFGLRARAAAGGQDRGVRDKVLDALASVRAPGTSAWASMDVAQRCRWWVFRVGRVTTVAAAVPGLGGALARTLPVSSALGAAGQGLLLCAVAGEHGIDDEDTVIALLGAVLFERDLAPRGLDPKADAAADARAAEISGELGGTRTSISVASVAGVLWRLGRALYSVEDELGKRPHGRFYHEAVSLIPGIGALGKYLGVSTVPRNV